MADSFTPNTDAEIAPAFTPEQEAQLIASGDLRKEQAQHPNAETTQEDLILGKFKTQEDLVDAYQGLEQKLGAEGNATGSLGSLIKESGDYYNENGEMSDEHYKKFEANGISREYVDQYLGGLHATATAETTKLFGTIGGEDNFKEMSEWMGESLPQTEVEAYNNVVSKGTTEEVTVLLQGMYARYQAATGAGKTQIQGTVSSTASGFRSRGEVMQAMSDPRYGSDAAFRADVERKLSVTPNTVF